MGPMGGMLGAGIGGPAGVAGGGLLGMVLGSDFVKNLDESVAAVMRFVEALAPLMNSFERLLPTFSEANGPFAQFVDLMVKFVELVTGVLDTIGGFARYAATTDDPLHRLLFDNFGGGTVKYGEALMARDAAEEDARIDAYTGAAADALHEAETGWSGLGLSGEELKNAEEIKGAAAGKVKGRQAAPNYDFRGSNFYQEFKEANPDRVIQIFKHDMEKQATAPTQSPYGAPFPV